MLFQKKSVSLQKETMTTEQQNFEAIINSNNAVTIKAAIDKAMKDVMLMSMDEWFNNVQQSLNN